MNAPAVSIIVPIYKVERYLRRCVDSILAQTLREIEIILIDDGSPDGCGKICDEYAQSDSRIKVMHKRNGGLSDARNAGIKIATGLFLAFLDSDDWVMPDMYEKMYKQATLVHAEMVFCDYWVVDSKFRPTSLGTERKFPIGTIDSGQALKLLLNHKIESFAWSYLAKRDLFKTNNIWFPFGRKYEDISTTYRAIAVSSRIGFVKDKLYYYFQRSDSITRVSDLQSAKDVFFGASEMEQYISRYFPELRDDLYAFEATLLVFCYIVYCKALFNSKGNTKDSSFEETVKSKFQSMTPYKKLTGRRDDLRTILMQMHLIKPLVFLKNKLISIAT